MFAQATSPLFAGRETELDVLARAFDAAAQGTPVMMLVAGEAGCGKSRLVREFASRIVSDATPPLVLSGECPDIGGPELPYAPFAGVVRDLIRQRGMAEVAELVPHEAISELAAVLPEFGPPARTIGSEFARSRLFGVVLTLLEQLAAGRPTVLIVEDLHWADGPSRDLLSFLARNLRAAAVLLIATFRSDELPEAHPLRRLLAEVGRVPGTTRIELDRMSRTEVAAQIEGILGRPPAATVVNAVFERSDGNPLFTEAVLNSDGTVAAGLPRSLEDMLADRFSQLPPETQRVLQAATVGGGSRISHALLVKVTDLDHRQLSDALRPAVATNVIVLDDDDYLFRHDLIRSALQQRLLAGERAQLHRDFAEALETEPSLASQPLPVVQVAMHWHAAAEFERALPVAWQAAGIARDAFAYPTQLRMLEMTLQLWHQVPSAASLTGVDQATVVDRALDAARLAGEPQRGLTLLEEAQSEHGSRDPERGARLLLARAMLRQQLLLPGQLDDLRTALRLAKTDRTRAQILGPLIRVLRLLDHDEEADALAQEMLDLATRLEDNELVLEASIRLAAADARTGDDGVARLERCAEDAQRLGAGELELLARVLKTYAMEGRGDHQKAVLAGRADLARMQQLGLSRYVTAPIAWNLVESLTSAGAWDEALEIIDATLRLDPAPFGLAGLLVHRSQIDLARGNVESARRGVEELDSLLPTEEVSSELGLSVACLRLELQLADGDVETALARARELADEPPGRDPRYLWPALATAMRVCADIASGDGRHSGLESGRVQRAIAERATHLDQPSRLARAYAVLVAAESSRADRRPDVAKWDAAADGWRAVGQPYALGYALLRGSEAAAVAGDRRTASEQIVQCATIANQLRADGLLDQAIGHARRARLKLPAELVPSSTDSAASLNLTRRETEVLRLVAAGQSNKQIAAELFISPKTASVHVSRILAKLEVSTRTEAAARAHSMRLFDAD